MHGFGCSGGEPAIWIAWNEEACFQLWAEKKALLFKLEAALKARRILGEVEGSDGVKKVQLQLEEVNARLDKASPKQFYEDGEEVIESEIQFHTPVAVFATFESSKSFDAALKLKQLKMRSSQGRSSTSELTVSIKGAPEPETILWENLQYTQKQRRLRAATIMLCTVTVLLLGVWLIVVVR